MPKSFLKSIFYILFIAITANLYGSDNITEEFIELEVTPSINSLFPEQFTAEQIEEFYKRKQTSTSAGTFFVYDDFHATKPYFFQILTGTRSAFASCISFTGTVEIEENCLWGIYSFRSSYTTYNNKTFKVKLVGDSFKTFNLSDSVLGDKDFISSQAQPLKDASFYYLKNTDEEWVRQTNSIHRLNKNIKSWLLILAQLQGDDIYNLKEDERAATATMFFQKYLNKKNFTLSNEGVLSMDQYVEINKELRSQILACHGIQLKDIPEVSSQEDLNKLFSGEIYFAVLTKKSN